MHLRSHLKGPAKLMWADPATNSASACCAMRHHGVLCRMLCCTALPPGAAVELFAGCIHRVWCGWLKPAAAVRHRFAQTYLHQQCLWYTAGTMQLEQQRQRHCMIGTGIVSYHVAMCGWDLVGSSLGYCVDHAVHALPC